eukprot:SAG11_NODE_1752_length_4316_cov_4.210576_4_plen_59_part_00
MYRTMPLPHSEADEGAGGNDSALGRPWRRFRRGLTVAVVLSSQLCCVVVVVVSLVVLG